MLQERLQAEEAQQATLTEQVSSLGETLTITRTAFEVIGTPKMLLFNTDINLPWPERMGNLIQVARVKKALSTQVIPEYENMRAQIRGERRESGQIIKRLKEEIEIERQKFFEGYRKIDQAVFDGYLDKSELDWAKTVATNLGIELPKEPEATELVITFDNLPSRTPNLDVLLPTTGDKRPKFESFLKSGQLLHLITCLQAYFNEVGLGNIDKQALEKRANGFVFQCLVERELRSLIGHRTKGAYVQIDSDLVFKLWEHGYPDRKVTYLLGGLGVAMEGITIPDGLILGLQRPNNTAQFLGLYETSLVSNPTKSNLQKQSQFEAIRNGTVERGLAQVLNFEEHKQTDPDYETKFKKLLEGIVDPDKHIGIIDEDRFVRFYFIPRQGNSRSLRRRPERSGVEFIESSFFGNEVTNFATALIQDIEYQYQAEGGISQLDFCSQVGK